MSDLGFLRCMIDGIESVGEEKKEDKNAVPLFPACLCLRAQAFSNAAIFEHFDLRNNPQFKKKKKKKSLGGDCCTSTISPKSIFLSFSSFLFSSHCN